MPLERQMLEATRPKYAWSRIFVLGACAALAGVSGLDCRGSVPERLSDYRLFSGELAAQRPAAGVVPYAVNTPLFSDGAEKLRFVQLPSGEPASYRSDGFLDFPVGTRLVKTFYYPVDRRSPAGPRRLVETRLLIREADGWVGLPYVWNELQTEAQLRRAGARVPVEWIDEQGERRSVEYRVPSVADCGLCHRTEGRLMAPIATKVSQLNRIVADGDEPMNQLARWQRRDLLVGLPPVEHLPHYPAWDDPTSGSLEERARAYLDANCAHCHSPTRSASSSRLDLRYAQRDPWSFGVFKRPVAAGRGSGDRLYDIWPGRPEASILLYRMESVEPAVMMPELGRTIVDLEGVEAVRAWIARMDWASHARSAP